MKLPIETAMIESTARQMENAIFGEAYTQSSRQTPPLTFEKLVALHDYLKPEKLTVAGEEMEIYGFNVHTAFCPNGITVLTEKDNPNDPMPRRGKMVVIDENAGVGLIYDPSKK